MQFNKRKSGEKEAQNPILKKMQNFCIFYVKILEGRWIPSQQTQIRKKSRNFFVLYREKTSKKGKGSFDPQL